MPIFSSEHPANSSLIEDAECYVMKIIRHVCAGLKHYFEAHLHIKVWKIQYRAKIRDSDPLISSTTNFYTVPGYKVWHFKNLVHETKFLFCIFFSLQKNLEIKS